MIRSLALTCFRKHLDTHVDFTSGLNVIRGPNEAGKTTLTEGILYALYGTKALVDPLSEVVTWGHKETLLRVELIVSVSGIDYTFTRSKGGAECNYAAGGSQLKVVGQSEVTSFAAKLLGADAKTAGALMLASQSGLRGALDDGPAAVSALIGKLADFDLIDRLLETANQTLTLGAEKPLQEKLAVAEATRDTSKAALDSHTGVAALDERIVNASQRLESANLLVSSRQTDVTRANEELADAVSHEHARQAVAEAVSQLLRRKAQEGEMYALAVAESATKPSEQDLTLARQTATDTEEQAATGRAYATFLRIPQAASYWQGTPEGLVAHVTELERQSSGLACDIATLQGELRAARAQIITSGKCPTCGAESMSDEHVQTKNAATNEEISRLESDLRAHSASRADVEGMLEGRKATIKVSNETDLIVASLAGRVNVDTTRCPAAVTWRGAVPSPVNSAEAKRKLTELQARAQAATQAEGRAFAHASALAVIESDLKRQQNVLGQIPVVDVDAVRAIADEAYGAYSEATSSARGYQSLISALTAERQAAVHARDVAQADYDKSVTRVAELRADISALAFNNELVKKLKSIKPLITDHLWNAVLQAVSNYFSNLRGEQSVVTKTADGFQVNGRGGSLSGSTLDMLALAIRVALSKTFVPHASFIVLDEPAHGCDVERTGNVLGFLSSVGLDQTILASHDELSEAVADNLITLEG